LKLHLVQGILRFWALIQAQLVGCSPPLYPMTDAGPWPNCVFNFFFWYLKH